MPVYELFQNDDENDPYLVMKCIIGKDLKQEVDDIKVEYDADNAKRFKLLPVFSQLCDVIDACHKMGIVHGDPKLANMLLQPDGYGWVIDWAWGDQMHCLVDKLFLGFSQYEQIMQVCSSMVGNVIGTPAYMAPEAAIGLGVSEQQTFLF